MSGLLLAFDTSTEALAVGVMPEAGGPTAQIDCGYRLAPRQANSLLLESVVEVLASMQAGISDVSGIIVGRGPGSFTGVRIGVAAAKGLAQGLGVPLVGVGTLDAIAWRFAEHEGLVGVVGDAMRGEVYPALFRVSVGVVERLSADRVALPEVAAREWAEATTEPLTLTGNGLAKHADAFVSALGARVSLAPEDLWWPSGAGLLQAFSSAGGPALFEGADPGAVLPIYTRLSDAEEAERARRGLAAVDAPASGVIGADGASGRDSR